MEDTMSIPKDFINKYMPMALPVYSNIYIYCLCHAYNKRISICANDIAKKFNILETDVFNACNFWVDKNLIDIDIDKKGNINIEFLPINEVNETLSIRPLVLYPNTQNIANDIDIAPANNINVADNKVIFYNKPVYSPKELEIYKANYSEIDHIFGLTEKALGTLFSANDLSTIFGFYDWLRLPLDVIEVLLTYCVDNGHRNINYIEKIAIDWAENSINTKELALEHIKNFGKNYREILKAVGQSRRDPTTKEIEYIDKWLGEYNLPLDIILEACDKTMMNLGKPQFSYTDKILEVWAKSKVKTIDDIKALESNYKIKNIKETRKSKFVNYEETPTDYDELELVGLELLKSSIKR